MNCAMCGEPVGVGADGVALKCPSCSWKEPKKR